MPESLSILRFLHEPEGEKDPGVMKTFPTREVKESD
jgi:hypothetical protein